MNRARLLNADIILIGSLTRRASRLIVNAELVDVKEATRLWGGEFSRPQGDVLAVHDEIAAAIIRDGLGVSLDEEDQRRFKRALTSSPGAYDLYLQAVHHFRLQQEEAYLDARDLLTQAISEDGAFALAWVTLASTYSVMAVDGDELPATAWRESRRAWHGRSRSIAICRIRMPKPVRPSFITSGIGKPPIANGRRRSGRAAGTCNRSCWSRGRCRCGRSAGRMTRWDSPAMQEKPIR